jgi:hypothetical protein
MRIVKIESLENGAHVNKTGNFNYVPAGYAVIPDGMTLPASFPFVDLEVKEIDGIMTVVSMSEREVPVAEPVKAEPSAQDDTDALLIDHEYRITLLELGVSE